MAVLTLAEILSKRVRKTTEASSKVCFLQVIFKGNGVLDKWLPCGFNIEGRCRVSFLLLANIYFKRIVLAKLLKSFNEDLSELGTGGMGINLRSLETSLTSSLERALFEKIFMPGLNTENRAKSPPCWFMIEILKSKALVAAVMSL